MRVSIVTPSFNQAPFLEQAILSVLNQTYPDIEYILIDGGSTDGSLEIINKYKNRFAYSQSKKDRGHWDAVNQGFQKATGEILCFLNSDDLLMSRAVDRIVESFQQYPEIGMIYGKAKLIDSNGNDIHDYPSRQFNIEHIFRTWENPVPQPSAFFRKEVFEKYSTPDERTSFGDFEFWIRISSDVKFSYLEEYLSCMRIHPAAKSSRLEGIHAQELIDLCEKLIQTERFKKSGVPSEESLRAVYHRASIILRRAGHKKKALETYFQYCKRAFSPPVALYRFCRYLGSMMLNRW